MMYIWLIACAFVCAYTVLWLSRRRARRLLAHLPTYPPLPIIGNVHQLFGNGEFLMKTVTNTAAIIEEKKLPFLFWVGPNPFVIVSNPDEVRAVTNTFVEKPYFYGFVKDLLGNGLLTAPGSIWKQNIKQLAGTFNGSVVDGYQEIFNTQAQILVEKLKGEVGGQPFDILSKHLAIRMLETICQTAIGASDGISKELITIKYYEAFRRKQEMLVSRLMNIVLHFDFVYKLTPAYKEFMEIKTVLRSFCESVITRRRLEREEKRNKTETLTETKAKLRLFIDILLDMQEMDSTISDDYIKSEVLTIIIAGHETVSTTLLFAFLMIARYSDIQEKIYAEIKNIFGDSKRPVTKEDLVHMKYCEAVIKETLRVYPPAPFIMRDADQDLQLKSCTIPKGTGCGVNIWGTNRLKSFWGEDAGQFRPERWLERELPEHSPNFIPFSFGRRACIGKKYAMHILKTTFAYCIREFVFEADAEEIVLKVHVILKAVRGHLLRVRLRE